MKRVLVLILVASLAFSLAACGAQNKTDSAQETKQQADSKTETKSAGDQPAKKVELAMWRHVGTATEDQYYNQLVDSFNKSQDKITIKQTSFPDNTYHDQVRAAGLSGDLPHILDMDGTEMSYMTFAGFLAPLDSYISEDLKKDLLPSIISQGTYKDGKIYLLGQFDSGLSFWANKSYLEKAGVRIPKSVDEAWTKTEFEDALAKLKGVSGVKYPLDLKINYGAGYWIYSYLPWAKGFGGDYINRDTLYAEGALNSEKTIEAYKYVKWMIDKGYVNPTQSTDDDFYGTKISALSLAGHWMAPAHIKEMGDDAILVPFPDFGSGVFTGMGSFGWAITSKASKESVGKDSWEFLNYALTKENIEGIFKANGAVPARISVLNGLDDYKEGGKFYLYREQLEKGHAIVRPVSPAFGVFQKEIGQASLNIVTGADIKAELDKATKAIDQAIDDAGYNK